jgi:DNA processing protein
MLNAEHLLIFKSLTRALTVAQWKKVIAKFSLIDVTTQQLYGSFSSLFPEYPLTEFLAAENKAKEILQQCQKNNIQLIGYFDTAFPDSLKNIEQPPVLLFIKGDASLLLSQMSLAVIGTREPSMRGLKTATKISERLAKAGYVIISGLAVGCDTAAHRGCILGEGKTIAILAHGLDSVYPTQNISLAKEIIEKGGCLISEYPPGTKANPSYFIKRDRLQSGLSKAVKYSSRIILLRLRVTKNYAKKVLPLL